MKSCISSPCTSFSLGVFMLSKLVCIPPAAILAWTRSWYMWKSVSYMADSESAQTYGPPEWTEQHVINQPLVLKDVVLALSSVWKIEQRTEGGGGKQKNSRDFSIILILFLCVLTFWQLNVFIFLPLSLSNSFVCLPWSVFIRLPLALSFSHNCVWTRGSFSTGLAATGGQRKRDRESEQWGGLADAPCYFSSASHWLCQQWLSLSRASELRGAWQHALFSYQWELITGMRRRQKQEQVRGFHHCTTTFSPFYSPPSSWLCSSHASFSLSFFCWSRLQILLNQNPTLCWAQTKTPAVK